MKMEHILIELFLEDDADLNQELEQGAKLKELIDSSKGCTIVENEIAYAGKNGFVHGVEDSIGFGGEMDIDSTIENSSEKRKDLIGLWEKVCKEKIDEAYEEYMVLKSKYLEEN
ncbi:hypothetical protein [Enterococcus crotali]|uniref:hypothetical protein n=1 Tax=Enterococcus crotali TaxID=1453587 RepID=UPI00047269EE|nr:hypothetical protein [Enterococcus crotali]